MRRKQSIKSNESNGLEEKSTDQTNQHAIFERIFRPSLNKGLYDCIMVKKEMKGKLIISLLEIHNKNIKDNGGSLILY